MEAYRDRMDRNTFIQNLLLDNLLLVDVYNKAKKLRIDAQARRLVYIVETADEGEPSGMEILRGLFAENGKDFITAVDESSLIYVQELGEEDAAMKRAPITEDQDMQSIVAAAEAFMRSHLDGSIHLDDICKNIGVSRTTLKRLFRQTLSTSVMEHYQSLRLQEACRHLRMARCIHDELELLYRPHLDTGALDAMTETLVRELA
jgi:AraC-like DNA-binding protein